MRLDGTWAFGGFEWSQDIIQDACLLKERLVP